MSMWSSAQEHIVGLYKGLRKGDPLLREMHELVCAARILDRTVEDAAEPVSVLASTVRSFLEPAIVLIKGAAAATGRDSGWVDATIDKLGATTNLKA